MSLHGGVEWGRSGLAGLARRVPRAGELSRTGVCLHGALLSGLGLKGEFSRRSLALSCPRSQPGRWAGERLFVAQPSGNWRLLV